VLHRAIFFLLALLHLFSPFRGGTVCAMLTMGTETMLPETHLKGGKHRRNFQPLWVFVYNLFFYPAQTFPKIEGWRKN
jgi:hypothetical protein